MTSNPANLYGSAERVFPRHEVACWLGGVAFTFGLFLALANIETTGDQAHTATIMDMPVVALPVEPPPPVPKLSEPVQTLDDPPPLTGIDIGSSDSAIKIAVVPPDVAALLSENQPPPKALVSLSHLSFVPKPKVGMQIDLTRIYQQSEVDRLPRAVIRVAPNVPSSLFGDASSLAVELMLLIDATGHAQGVRVMKSSGSPTFDEIVAKTVKDQWVFSPAIKRGHKVRCLVSQYFRVNISGGTPFGVQ